MDNPLIRVVKREISSNQDNAARHRMQGTEEDLKIANRYDRESALLEISLTEALASMED